MSSDPSRWGKLTPFFAQFVFFVFLYFKTLYYRDFIVSLNPWMGENSLLLLSNIWEDEEGEEKGANLDLKLQLAERSIYRRNLENMHF